MIPSQRDGSVDSRRLAQLSRSHVILDQHGLERQVPSMLRNGSISLGLWKPEAKTATWMKPLKIEEPRHDVEMLRGTIIEKSIATKQPEQSSPPIKSFFQEIHPCWPTKGKGHSCHQTLISDWKVTKRVTRLVSTSKPSSRCWRSTWLVLSVTYVTPRFRRYRGSDKPRFSVLPGFKRTSYTSDPFKVIQEVLWLILKCCITLKFHLDGRSTWAMSEVHQQWHIASGKDTKEGRQTVFFTALDPLRDDPDEEYQDLSTPRKVQYKSKWEGNQGALYWVPTDCVERVVSTKQDKILYQRNPTPRPAPKNCVERSLASTARWRKTAADKHREIDRGTGKSIQNRHPNARCTTETSTWRSKTNNLKTHYRTTSMITDPQKNWCIQHIQRWVQKKHPNMRKNLMIGIESLSGLNAHPCAEYWPEELLYCTCGQC